MDHMNIGPRSQTAQMNAIDTRIGRRIRIERTAKGMTQSALGDAIGVTFQQIQKYEKGKNRIGAGRLVAIANVLDVSFCELFGDKPDLPNEVSDLMELPGAIKLLRLWARITPTQRETITDMIGTIARS